MAPSSTSDSDASSTPSRPEPGGGMAPLAREADLEAFLAYAQEGAREVLQCGSTSEDAAQNVMLRIVRKGAECWQSIRNPAAYFRRAGRLEALMLLRGFWQRADVCSLEAVNHPLASSESDPLTRVLEHEERKVIIAEIERLPQRCSAVMRRVLEGNSRREIASELGVRLGAVEKQVTRGYARLGRALSRG